MFKNNRRLLVISAITLIGSLGYGIIIPILYAFSFKYGLSAFGLGVLFSTYSICEFISTPFIGILSDKYGRRPLLIISLIGTAASFFLMAFAPIAALLFFARALDGITAGNFPVAQAIISDSTEKKDRTKGFGIIGACYGIGLIAGPAISALTAGVSIRLPFIIAGVLSAMTVIIAIFLLDETNQHIGHVEHRELFDWKALGNAMLDRATGTTLLVSFLWSFAFGMFIYSYQAFSLNTLHLTPAGISLTFLLFGVTALVTQLFIVPRFSKHVGKIRALSASLSALALSYLILLLVHGSAALILVVIIMAVSSTTVQTLAQTLLSEETPPHRQGEIMGIGTSYISIGQIIGPLTAGSIAVLGASYSFVASAVLISIGLIFSMRIRLSAQGK